MLDEFMAVAEAESDDPAEQLVAFVREFERSAGELAARQPGCLFDSFIYERQLADLGNAAIIANAILQWRGRLLAKDPTHLQAQLAHLRHYLTLLFRLPV